MLYDPKIFPVLTQLRSQTGIVQQEMAQNLSERPGAVYAPHPKPGMHNNSWNLCGLYWVNSDGSVIANDKHFPKTLAILTSIPGAVKATFSTLKAGTVIKPHTDPFHNTLRIHWGIEIHDSEKCGLKVEGKTVKLKNGECLVFDETTVHEAWNLSSKDRVVLFLDVDIDIALAAAGHRVPEGVTNLEYMSSFALSKSSREKASETWQKARVSYYDGYFRSRIVLGKIKRRVLGKTSDASKMKSTEDYLADKI